MNSVLIKLPHYWKTIIATIPVVLFVGTAVFQAIAGSSTFTAADILRILVVGATAYGVYKKSNAPKKTQNG